ncbi:MAG: aminopeptidase [Lachnospiraceae bacterium]|nr:aminopeptidase [Lachnospiraceae bacterium]
MDPRIKKLSANLVHYSMHVMPGEKVLIHATGEDTKDLARQMVKDVYAAGGLPFVKYENERLTREIQLGANEDQLKIMAKVDAAEMAEMDCYAGIRGSANLSEQADVPSDRMALYQRLYWTPVHGNIRIPKTRWVVLRYPNNSMAQSAGMSLEAFEDFYFDVCTMDYAKMATAMEPLVDLMNRTDRVHIKGPGTNLTFSIKDIPAIPCAGELNIPDGEVYTAPVRDSVNGRITYNTPSVNQGFTFENISLLFKDGKIIEATSNDNKRINEIFDTDEGARYVGEFAIGVNPYVTFPMKDILFDEKIKGSFHFTPGRCYDEAPNGNRSSIHWDLVCIQRPEYGGGEIYFDDVLIRKDGRFTLPELQCLNPENLM